ncbi:unnamed protein product [Mytilus coruscus]|uniref:Uncharacterized protein n=1 Tax=Mytilus coruscus TaxID=42192 RepID=A0A6J8BA17_MYTCO|nr:unnamed protein product [Mytilus coruscus]
MYIICKFKSPNSCLSDEHVHDAEMFEEERHKINTVTHQQSHHQPRFYIRRESFWKITRRKSMYSNIVCRQCEQTLFCIRKNNQMQKDDIEMKNNIIIIKNVANQKCSKTKTVLALPDVGQIRMVIFLKGLHQCHRFHDICEDETTARPVFFVT